MIDQLELSAREGYLQINDIVIDCNIINDEFLNDFPFQVMKYHYYYVIFINNNTSYIVKIMSYWYFKS